MKRCSMCHQEKPLKQFNRNKGKKGGLRSECRACGSSYARKQRYDLSQDDYQRMLDEQKGVCAICGRPETRRICGTVISLAVDHDHTTGAVRGLLCHNCNVGVGLFGDSANSIAKALVYMTAIRDFKEVHHAS
jgi:Recombination endonuclease VII